MDYSNATLTRKDGKIICRLADGTEFDLIESIKRNLENAMDTQSGREIPIGYVAEYSSSYPRKNQGSIFQLQIIWPCSDSDQVDKTICRNCGKDGTSRSYEFLNFGFYCDKCWLEERIKLDDPIAKLEFHIQEKLDGLQSEQGGQTDGSKADS